MTELVVGIAGVNTAWAAALRAHVSDHVGRMRAVTARDPREVVAVGGVDVLVVDDLDCLFDALDVGLLHAANVPVVGLHDPVNGRGARWLAHLGVDRVELITVSPSEIVALIQALTPEPSAREASRRLSADGAPAASGSGVGGALTWVSATSCGVGLTEVAVGLTQRFAKCYATLLVEADEISPSLAVRLGLAPDRNLVGVLAAGPEGYVFPDVLTPPRPDGGPTAPVAFDVIAGAANPGGPPYVAPNQLMALLEAARGVYPQVVVVSGPLMAAVGVSDRFAAGRAVAAAADRLVCVARSDGEGVARLVAWLSAARELNPLAPAWAAFSMVPRDRFVRSELRLQGAQVQAGIAGRGLEAIHLLPYSRRKATECWNGTLLTGGPWQAAIRDLADQVAAAPVRPRPAVASSNGRRPRPVRNPS